jgi:O-antigen/teichoic acid export membrane protein
MNVHYREIIRHSMVYGVGQVLLRLASVGLLPLYTRYLHPADYGTIAIIDLTTTVLGILIGGGLVAAANRYHFETQERDARAEIWWTALGLVAIVAAAFLIPAFLARRLLAHAMLGPALRDGAWFYALALPTVWCAAVSEGQTRTSVRVNSRRWRSPLPSARFS